MTKLNALPRNDSFIHCMLIPLQQHYLLLPNSSIAEVVPKTGYTAASSASGYHLGHVGWRDRQLAVIDLETMLVGQGAAQRPAAKFCIVNGINPHADLDYYAIPCTGSPQLITLNQTALRRTHDEDTSPFLYCRIKIGSKAALIPDLDRVETAIQAQK